MQLMVLTGGFGLTSCKCLLAMGSRVDSEFQSTLLPFTEIHLEWTRQSVSPKLTTHNAGAISVKRIQDVF